MNNQLVAFIPTHMLHHKFYFTIYIIPVYYFVAFWVDLIRGSNCHNNQKREATSKKVIHPCLKGTYINDTSFVIVIAFNCFVEGNSYIQ